MLHVENNARRGLAQSEGIRHTLSRLRADFLLRIAANDNNGRQAAYLQVPLRYFGISGVSLTLA